MIDNASRSPLKELRTWASGLTAAFIVASYWFWGPLLIGEALDFASWLVAYASTAGHLM